MAETIKKSRIVSEELCDSLLDEDSSLQDIINEEFNQRLKSCMNDEIQAEEYEVLKNGHNLDLTQNYSETEVLTEKQNGLKNSLPESEQYEFSDKSENNSPEIETVFPSTETAKDRFLSTVNDLTDDTHISSTAKDRLFLSTDSACLIFNQTVVQSPMLTPTEENYDFLQGISNTEETFKDESLSEKFSALKLNDTLENTDIKSATLNLIEAERKSFEEQNSISETDGEIPLVKITEVSPDYEEKSFEELLNQESFEEKLIEDKIDDSPILDTQKSFEESSNLDTQEDINSSNLDTQKSFDDNLSSNLEKEEIVLNVEICEDFEEKLDSSNLDTDNGDVQQALDEIEQVIEDYEEQNYENLETHEIFMSEGSPENLATELQNAENLIEEQKLETYEIENIEVVTEEQNLNTEQKLETEILDAEIQINESLNKDQTEGYILDNLETEQIENKEILIEEQNIELLEQNNDIGVIEQTDINIQDQNIEQILDTQNIGTEQILDTQEQILITSEQTLEIQEINLDLQEQTIELEEQKLGSPEQTEEQLVDTQISPIQEQIIDSSEQVQHEFKEQNGIFETVQKTKEIFEKKSSPNEKEFVPKSYSLIRKLDTSPNRLEDDVFEQNNSTNSLSTTTTSESSFVETTTEAKSQEKVLKKKKSKKSKKDSEKENISVSDYSSTNDEDCLSHVSVRNLRAKSMSDIRKECDSNSRPLKDNVFGGVNVKLLRESFNKLISNNTNNGFHKTCVAPPPTKSGILTRLEKLKSSFSKFDALQKKTVLHVRSTEGSKAPDKFNGSTPIQDQSNCKACAKQVFQMEQIKAEKAIWHKNCFRCKECNKQLTVDTYQSNEGVVYCKPHFKQLFAPKVVEDTQPIRPRKHELIIRENQPEELPPDVVRASDKPDLGLDELQNLNVKERFQVFQNSQENENSLERTPSAVNVKRSPSILSKLATFQKKGMDIGVNDESLNGVPIEESSSESESEEDDGITGEDADLIRAKRAQREKPMHFNNMSDIMSKWESGNQMSKEERREERKQEIQSIRSKLFMGKQAKIKEMYQQAVAESESGANVKKHVATEVCENAKLIKEKFEKGETLTQEEEQNLRDSEDMSVFDSGISKKSRSIFLELDANAAKAPQMTPLSPAKSTSDVRRAREAFATRHISEDVVRSTDQVDDVTIETTAISNRFKFFETYKEPEREKKRFRITPPREGQTKDESPEREIYHDPTIVRSSSPVSNSPPPDTHTTTKMLSIFRQMEENMNREPEPLGPKPLKRFTPPPEPTKEEEDSAEEEEESDDEEEESDGERVLDDDLLEAQKAARAKQLRAKFEKWEANEIQREQNNSSINLATEFGEEQSQIESAKSLRARFESMREVQTTKERPKVKVNRFVDTTNNVETCKSCEGRVYPLEKVSCHNNVYHKNCFRCRECNTILRMDSYTYNQGLLYCTPHFKRLFISKGNYESGFGLGQHKEKWNIVS